MTDDPIDYDRIARAVAWYACRGYRPIAVPWAVSALAYQATQPPGTRDILSPMGRHVASGEQSFLELMLQGTLPKGRYQCTTPCFRDEPGYDDLRQPWFLKVELIAVEPDDPGGAAKTLRWDAAGFLAQFAVDVRHVPTVDGVDLEVASIEVGSYGHRTVMGHTWAYGTGLAEPRFEQAKRRDWERQQGFTRPC